MYSVFAFQVQSNNQTTTRNVLADDSGGRTALENAIAAIGDFQSVALVGGRAVDLVIDRARLPFVDDTPKALYSVNFVPNGLSGLMNSLVLSWPQSHGNETVSASLLAAQAAAKNGIPGGVSLMANIDIDATTPQPQMMVLSKVGFSSLFTFTELVGIYGFAASTTLTTDQKAVINALLEIFRIADNISLADPTTAMGVNFFASCGLITTARAGQILNAELYLTVQAPAIAGTHGVAIAPVSATAAGGSATGFSFSAAGLPTGLAMASNGQITGTPTTAGTYTYTVTATDSVGDTATSAGTVVVS